MKKIIIIVMLLIYSLQLSGRTIYSTNINGDWTNINSWSCSCLPIGGDTINIRVTDTVTISTNITITGLPLIINIYGTLAFNVGKITLPTQSIVYLFGKIDKLGSNSGSSSLITIGNTDVWKASDGDQTGYKVYTDRSLPVELLYFNVKYNNDKVIINWATAQEINNKGFEVEKSYDGISFSTLSYIDGNGNSSNINNYEIYDINLNERIIYYRLKQIDYNGTIEIFKIKSVYINNYIISNKETYKIINLSGKEINSNYLKSGIYIIQIIINNELYQNKILIE